MEEDGTLFARTKREQVMIRRDRDKPTGDFDDTLGQDQLRAHHDDPGIDRSHHYAREPGCLRQPQGPARTLEPEALLTGEARA